MNKKIFNNNSISVITLGGVEEIGFNSTIIEYNNSIFLIDFGLGFPNGDLYGIDYLIPNLDYLKQNKSKIKGIIVTHGHLDHIGGLQYAIDILGNIPIYGTDFTLEIIKNHFKSRLFKYNNLLSFNTDTVLKFNEISFEFFHINHSIPHSVGVVFKCPDGNIVFTGDFKFDNSPLLEKPADYGKIAKFGNEGVLALLSDSTNSFKTGHSKSEQEIKQSLFRIIESAKGRVIISSFASLVGRIIQLIDIAANTNRKVGIAGRSMVNNLEVAKKFGYLKGFNNIFYPLKQIQTLKDEKVMVLATGSQGEEMAALSRIIKNKHPDISIKKGDTIILSSSIIPGNEIYVQNLLDELSKLGAIVYQQSEGLDTHTSGHAYEEDQKLMINLVKPKYFIPVHGYQSFLYKHALTAKNIGFNEKNIIVPKRGERLVFSNSEYIKSKSIKSMPMLVSGTGVGDIGAMVLSERQQLGNNGVIIYSAVIDYTNKKIIGHPQLLSKGLTYVKDNPKLFEQLNLLATQTITKELDNNEFKDKDLMNIIKQKLSVIVNKELNRNPMILVFLNTIN